MQNEHAYIGNIWANLWMSVSSQIRKILNLVNVVSVGVCNPAENTKRLAGFIFIVVQERLLLWLHVWSRMVVLECERNLYKALV